MPIYLNCIDSTTFKKQYYDAKSPYGYSGTLFNKDITDDEIRLFWKKIDEWYLKNNVVTELLDLV